MNDLVKRLYEEAQDDPDNMLWQAAQEIEKLRARIDSLEDSLSNSVNAEWHNEEIERLEKLLEQIASLSHCGRLLGLSETGALTEIRNLSFEFWKEYKHER